MPADVPTAAQEAAADSRARAPAAAPTGTGRLDGIDGVRAIGAFGILLVHVGLISGYSPTPWTRFGAYFARAEVGVTVFFLISGFVIWRPFVAAAFADRPAPAVGQFLARRFVRVVPLYWFVLTVVLFVQHRSPVHGLGDVVTFYGFLQIYRPGYEIEGVQQAWSLCTIVSFYLAAPALARLMRPGHRRLPAAGGARQPPHLARHPAQRPREA